MSRVQLPSLTTDQFEVHVLQPEDEQIELRLTGNADMSALPHLESFVPRLHDEVIDARVGEVVVDFTDLEFMNSSCFRTFVTWLSSIRKLEAEEQYKLRFRARSTTHWQQPSLRALSCFATNLVQVEYIDE